MTRTTIPVFIAGVLLTVGVVQQSGTPRTVAYPPGEPAALTYDAGATAPNSVRFLTSGDDTNGGWSLVELTEMPGTKTTWHRHPHGDQAYYIREGVFTVKVNDAVYQMPPGGYILISRGTPHGHANFGTVPVKTLLINAPAGFERYFQARVDLLKAMKPHTQDFQKRMSELRRQYDTEELGLWDIKK